MKRDATEGDARRAAPSGARAAVRRAASGLLLAALSSLATPPPSRAGPAGWVLPEPEEIAVVSAATFDSSGRRLGGATLSTERDEAGLVRVRISASLDAGGRMAASAELGPAPGGLRLLREEVQSYGADDRPFPLLTIDHVTGVATCTPAPGTSGHFERLDLPPDERVANVPLHLLFRPLAQGEARRIDFQMFLCRNGARLLDFRAEVAAKDEDGRVVAVRYRPDLGPLGWLVGALVPRLGFWFDARAGGRYVGHRMPLFPGGPDVLVVRDGFAVPSLPGL